MGADMIVCSYLPLLGQGIATSIACWITASCISGILGCLIGIASYDYTAAPVRTRIARLYSFIVKGIPAYVQILIAYFVLPALTGMTLPGFWAGTIALGICSSGYCAEIVRGALQALPIGQTEAARVLGYTRAQTIRCILLPQALRASIPALLGETEQLLKSSSLLATIGITDITRAGMNILSRELQPLPVYATIACIYLLFSALLTACMLLLERKYRYA